MHRKVDYTLKTGDEGAPRLELLNELCNPHSLNFINNAVQLRNKRILEVGSGVGIMAKEMAILALPEGKVLATDISNEQLDLAKSTAKKANVNNIEFMQISAINIDQINVKFDVIYIRFVLAHLPNALEIIQKALSLMHSDSVLICEEPEDVKSMFSNPPSKVFDWWVKAVDEQIKACKGKFTIGKNLFVLFKQNNLHVTHTKTVQPVMMSSRLKQQLWLGVREITPVLIASGFTTQDDIEKMIDALKKFADTPSSVGLFCFRQIAAKKGDVNNSNVELNRPVKF